MLSIITHFVKRVRIYLDEVKTKYVAVKEKGVKKQVGSKKRHARRRRSKANNTGYKAYPVMLYIATLETQEALPSSTND